MNRSDVPMPEQRAILPSGLRSALRCPLSGEELVDGLDEAGHPALISWGTGLAYLMRDGVLILLVHEVSRMPAPGPDSQG